MLAPQQTCLKKGARQESHAWRIFPVPYELLSIRGRRSRYSRPRVALLAAEGRITFGRESITFQASQEKNAGWRLVFMGRRKTFARIDAGAKQGKRASQSLHALRKRDGFRRAVWFAAHLPNTCSRLRALFPAIGFCGCLKSAPSSPRSTSSTNKKPFLQDKTFTKL